MKIVVSRTPNQISPKFGKIIANNLLLNVKKVLKLANEYARDFLNIENPWPLLDGILVQYSKVEDFQYLFVRLFYNLCKHYQIFREARFSKCSKAVLHFLSSRNLKTVKACYIYMLHFLTKSSEIDFNIIIFHLDYSISTQASLFISKYDPSLFSLNVIAQLIPKLLKIAKFHHVGNDALCNIALFNDFWICFQKYFAYFTEPLPEYRETFKLFLILTQNPNAYQKLEKTSYISTLFLNYIQSDNESLNDISSTLLTLMISENTIQQLYENGFMLYFYSLTEKSKNLGLMARCLRVFSLFSICIYVPFYDILIGKVYDIYLKYPQLESVSIDLLEKLCLYKQCAQKLSELDCSFLNSDKYLRQFNSIRNILKLVVKNE